MLIVQILRYIGLIVQHSTIRGREQLFWGDQLPIPTHYTMSVWGTSPPTCALDATSRSRDRVPVEAFFKKFILICSISSEH